jgi:hypothetical protein
MSKGARDMIDSFYYRLMHVDVHTITPEPVWNTDTIGTAAARLHSVRRLVTGTLSVLPVVAVAVKCSGYGTRYVDVDTMDRTVFPSRLQTDAILAYLAVETKDSVTLHMSEPFLSACIEKGAELKGMSVFADRLSYVTVEYCVLRKWQLHVILSFLPSTLEGLRLRECCIRTTSKSAALASALSGLVDLMYLDLGKNRMDFKVIVPGLAGMRNIKELDLKGTEIVPSDLISVLRATRTLTKLNLDQCFSAVTPELSVELFAMPCLIDLVLSRCSVSIHVLVDGAVGKNSTIERLDIGGNRIFFGMGSDYGPLCNLVLALPKLSELGMENDVDYKVRFISPWLTKLTRRVTMHLTVSYRHGRPDRESPDTESDLDRLFIVWHFSSRSFFE